VSAFLRLVRFTKTIALISALWTIVCSVSLLAWQVGSWLRDGTWSSYPLAAMIRDDREITYSMASYTESSVVGRVLEIPTIVLLVIAATLLLALYSWLATIEQQNSPLRR
jgi:hypothetical protein